MAVSLEQAIHDLSSILAKDEVREDTYTTESEAITRARALGCQGTHSIEEDGTMLYMPCETHDEYMEIIGTETNGYHDDDEKKPKKPKKKSDCGCQDNEDDYGYLRVNADIKSMHDEEEEGRFSGYGSIFGNTDLGNDVIMRGAFTKTLARQSPKNVKMLYQHKTDMPIGVFTKIEEDEKGLHVEGKLALGTQLGKDVHELMKMGALDGLSIGFRTKPKGHHYDTRSKKRIINDVELMEISVVTFPMNPKAKIRQVKAQDISIREWENGLRDAFGLSRSEAKVAAKAVETTFQRDAEIDGLSEAINTLTQKLNSLR